MFGWLFPSWTKPALVALVVGSRTFVNAALVALVARARSVTDGVAVVAAVLALFSTVLTVSVLRGDLGQDASYLEFVLQFALFGLAGYVAYSDPSTGRTVATVVAVICAVGLLLVMVPLYGEATVAP